MKEIKLSNKRVKMKQVFLWLGVIFCVSLIALSLDSLVFLPGQELTLTLQQEQTDDVEQSPPLEFEDLSVLTGVIAFVSVAIVLAVIGRLLLMLKWRSVLAGLLVILAGIFLLNLPEPQYQINDVDPPVVEQHTDITERNQLQVDTVGQKDPDFLYLAIIPLALLAVLLWRTIRKNEKTTSSLEDIFSEALEPGLRIRNAENIALFLYEKLIKYLQENKIIEMADYMTASEFAQVMIDLGLPQEPVCRMSALFEKARYSQAGLLDIENEEVVACVSEIYEFISQTE